MWRPAVTFTFPSGFTVPEWQMLQLLGSEPSATAGWPVGGIPWQELQVTAAGSFQRTVAWAPSTPRIAKFPWQLTLLQVFVTGSYVAPAARSAGSCEKSTANPVGAWHEAQVIPPPKVPPRRWLEWLMPEGTGPDDEAWVPLPPQPLVVRARKAETRAAVAKDLRMPP
jgi:hypothetical protein